MKIDLVVGARPNFVKAAAIVEAAWKYPDVKIRLIHTGQHEGKMSDSFFKELGLPDPILLNHDDGPRRFGNMLGILSAHWSAFKPDYVMVVGDTDSTLAGAIAAKKAGISLIHVEAGLRCGEKNMQEEINRKAVDSISDILYTTTADATDRLIDEGHSDVLFVGNVMIDTLFRFKDRAIKQFVDRSIFRADAKYAVLTLHRAENVDDREKLDCILEAVAKIKTPVIFPMHPRTQKTRRYPNGVILAPPYSYFDFIGLMAGAQFVMTDSGGIQEETTALGVPCLTLRPTTERPETVYSGTNHVIGTSPLRIIEMADAVLSWKDDGRRPELWDGRSADRIMQDLVRR